ncbi:hypothetical protein [Luteimonas kalidii]|uniref:Uncharacterized protein n=1 Tax=Luteimonas kalidii TaxID=3042025 RepID=A0ABT6JVN9_9GAMM|nr:hypothetical protein [Luteimonas kalidii]MDH5834241.1 hypothetical protein [Luteimonas kalidii]
MKSPLELQGATKHELEAHSRVRANRACSRFESFDDALEAAIDSGWILAYDSATGQRFVPNYARDALETPGG